MIGATNPYVGPRSFTTGESLHGRERELGELIDLLISERIVLLYSPSGAGKTSLIQAAMIPEMITEGYQVLPIARPGAAGSVLRQAAAGVNSYVARTIADWEEGRPDGESALDAVSGITLAGYLSQRAWLQRDKRLKLVILDQFEEVLTANPGAVEEKIEFFRQLGEALRNRKTWALFSMREEYSAALDSYRHLLPTRLGTRFRLDLLSRGEARKAICSPFETPKVEIEEAAVTHLLDELTTVREHTSDGTPVTRKVAFIEPLYLQIVCHRLWEILPEGTRSIAARQVGSREAGADAAVESNEVEKALEQYYAAAVAEAARNSGCKERRIREWLEEELVTPQGLRRQVLRGEQETAGLDNAVVEALAEGTLLRSDLRSGAVWYEVTHDRLAGVIRQGNAAWFEANLEPFQVRAVHWWRLRGAGAYRSAGHEVLQGVELRQAEQWHKHNPYAILSKVDREFLNYSLKAWKRGRRDRWMRSGLVILVVFLVFGWAFLEKQRNIEVSEANTELQTQSERERARALLSSSAAQKWRSHNHELASLLAIQAYRVSAKHDQEALLGPWTEDMLRTALQSRPFAYGHQLPASPGRMSERRVLLSRRPGLIATHTGDRTLTLRRVDKSGQQTRDIFAAEEIVSAAFTPRGDFLAVLTESALELIPADFGSGAEGQAERQLLPLGSRPPGPFCFSPNGRYMAIVVEHGAVRVWRLKPGKTAVVDHLHADVPEISGGSAITDLVCGDAGRWLAWGNRAGEVGLVDLTRHAPTSRWLFHNRFDAWPDALREALKHRRGTIDTGVSALHYLPGRQWLLAIHQHGPPRIYDLGLQSGAPRFAYLLPTAESKAALRIAQDLGWATRRVVNLQRALETDASPDERWVAIGGKRALVGLWDLTSTSTQREFMTDLAGQPPALERIGASNSVVYADYREQPGLGAAIRAIRFTRPMGWKANSAEEDYWLAATDTRSNVRWWSLAGLQGVGYRSHREGKPGVVYALAFLPHEREQGSRARVAFGGSWASAVLRIGHDDLDIEVDDSIDLPVRIRAFATDAEKHRLLIATGDVWAGTWERNQYSWLLDLTGKSGRAPMPLPGEPHTDGQWAAVTNAEGTLLLTAGWDGRAVVWRQTDAAEWRPEVLTRAEDEVAGHSLLAAALHPSGSDLVIGSFGGKVRRWRAEGAGFGQVEPLLEVDIPIRALAYSPDGNHLLAGDDNGFLWVWDIDAGGYQRRAQQVSAHTGTVYTISFGNDGRFVTGGSDGRVYLWPAPAKPIKPRDRLRLHGPASEVVAVAMAPAGDLVVAGDADGYIHVWELGLEKLIAKACAAMGRNLSWWEWKRYVHSDGYECSCPGLPSGSGVPPERLAQDPGCAVPPLAAR